MFRWSGRHLIEKIRWRPFFILEVYMEIKNTYKEIIILAVLILGPICFWLISAIIKRIKRLQTKKTNNNV